MRLSHLINITRIHTYSITPFAMTLNDLEGHSAVARLTSGIRRTYMQHFARFNCPSESAELLVSTAPILWTQAQCGIKAGEVTSQNLWPRYDRHFVGITWHNVWSSAAKIYRVI